MCGNLRFYVFCAFGSAYSHLMSTCCDLWLVRIRYGLFLCVCFSLLTSPFANR